MDNAWQVTSKRLPQLTLNFLLDISRDTLDPVKGRRNVDAFEGIVLEDESDAFLSRDDEDDNGAKGEGG